MSLVGSAPDEGIEVRLVVGEGKVGVWVEAGADSRSCAVGEGEVGVGIEWRGCRRSRLAVGEGKVGVGVERRVCRRSRLAVGKGEVGVGVEGRVWGAVGKGEAGVAGRVKTGSRSRRRSGLEVDPRVVPRKKGAWKHQTE